MNAIAQKTQTTQLPPTRILIVEDDPDARAVTQHILEYLQITVDVVADAEAAAHLLFEESTQYDVAIIDLSLPGRDGWQLLADIQSRQATASLKCVAMTAFHRTLLRDQALQAGFVEYFPKPINTENFIRLVQFIIDHPAPHVS